MTFHKETVLAQIGNQKHEYVGAINTPIYLSTAFRHEDIGQNKGYDYIRTGNPTRAVLEETIAKLEKGDRGFACSSGMSAIQLVFSLFESGDHIIASRDLYGGSYRYFEWLKQKYQITYTYWDERTDRDIEQLIQKTTKAIFIETPTNPLMNETDVKKIANISNSHQLLLIVDNTFYTPYIQRPIELGADIVIHSATKYLGGHNDLLAGLVVSKDKEISKRLFQIHNAVGAVLAPFDCWLLIRGMKTLALRMRQQEENALKIKKYLEVSSFVTDVYYPGRGGMISFKIKKEEWVSPLLKAIQLFTFAESLGGIESFITYPVTQTHADIPEAIRKRYGLCNRLLRISVGIEHAADLIADLEHAFQCCQREAVNNG
ncbi:methionine biosynthesis PLP-dependent protein [Bacillus sp. FJAT-50079]|uniref:methionine biosynthesis PLP-dependent protein n=1 Tax=Bacillus sp. FJAT-50079 TaxID=2833577 RepID=UPI001BC8E9A4|nr:methionine biosynthesis PLP-dependent protein [Bacillus sp. FJAT-50079]MBS4209971.1 methionine biosynthesis PLP-dependent protein [Bacillus sp. FJAT-50079]